MVADNIEREILIEASMERVWAVLTESEHLGQWFGSGAPTKIDLRVGGDILFDHGEHGLHAAVIEALEPPTYFAYRWVMTGGPEVPITPQTATLVEFFLTGDGPEATRLRMLESGFELLAVDSATVDKVYGDLLAGWPKVLEGLRQYAVGTPA